MTRWSETSENGRKSMSREPSEVYTDKWNRPRAIPELDEDVSFRIYILLGNIE